MQRVINDRKVAIVGCGFVGSATAFALMQSELFTEMVLIDVDRDRAEGEALDIAHGMPFAGPMNIYAGDYDDAADAAIVIVTAGANQQPGETRLDLVHKNVRIFKSIIPELAQRDYQGILLVVSNPVDILTHVALKLSGMPENRVIGSGTVLDTARFKYILGEHPGGQRALDHLARLTDEQAVRAVGAIAQLRVGHARVRGEPRVVEVFEVDDRHVVFLSVADHRTTARHDALYSTDPIKHVARRGSSWPLPSKRFSNTTASSTGARARPIPATATGWRSTWAQTGWQPSSYT